MPDPVIRKAQPSDVPEIHRLIEQASRDYPVIPRSHFEIYANLRDFFVYADAEERIRACCALHITWHDLAEVKSLVVDAELRGGGVGREMVLAALAEAREIGLERVFALTNALKFFEKIGFQRVEKHELPQKIWSECVRCSRFPDCDEEAVIFLTGVVNPRTRDLPVFS